MDGLKDTLVTVFGEAFLNEMAKRLWIIVCSLAAAVLIVAVISIWKSVACGKAKKAILSLSEHPDDKQAELFVTEIDKLSPIGKFLAKHSKEYSGLSRGDCRTIFNATVRASSKISTDQKTKIRDRLMMFGCTGLTDVDSI